jgi:hypothetical protein
MYKIREVNLNDDSPTCNTPTEIIEAVLSFNKMVFPDMDLMPEINKLTLTGMNMSQLAYSIAKVCYSTAYEASNNETDKEILENGIDESDMSETNMDKLVEISEKNDSRYAVFHLMYFKSRSEELMVETAFKIMESDKSIKKALAENETDYQNIKQKWKIFPKVRDQMINLSFRLRV